MRRLIRLLLPPVVLLLSASAQASVPEERVFEGPLHFCGFYFAMDVAEGERATWQQGPDFTIYSLQSTRGGFGIYEGNHPDVFEHTRQQRVVDGRTIQRLTAPNGDHSYLIEIPSTRIPTFLHLYGQVWRGDDGDLRLIARVRTGRSNEIGCNGPTVRQ